MHKIITWNVNGVNRPNKHKLVNHWLKKQKDDILCLQEVHIRNKDKKYIENCMLGLDFCSLSNKKTRGVVFYVKYDLCLTQIFMDSEGRFVGVEILFNRKKTSVVGIYAPNSGKDQFFKELGGGGIRECNFE